MAIVSCFSFFPFKSGKLKRLELADNISLSFFLPSLRFLSASHWEERRSAVETLVNMPWLELFVCSGADPPQWTHNGGTLSAQMFPLHRALRCDPLTRRKGETGSAGITSAARLLLTRFCTKINCFHAHAHPDLQTFQSDLVSNTD